MRNILIIGSGGLRVGQAGEFDYSGSQAIKAFKDDGYRVILANPNIATVQTDDSMADKNYLVPLLQDEMIKIFQTENIQFLALGFGGQTALNLGLELYNNGILDKYDIKILGSSVKSIEATEDRECFRDTLTAHQIKTPNSYIATDLTAALAAAEKIGYPLMLRSGYSLGGLGSGKILSKPELISKVSQVLSVTPHVLLEEYLTGWKEFEYEIVRDIAGNSLTICSMENLDPMGIHTGESIVVAPAQTLSDREHQNLRNIALKCAHIFDIIGECNIQFAVNPTNGDYRVIEMNPRLSRSSALASKATGYPLAYVAAKLCLGHLLYQVKNNLTGTTCAFFEPALDYIVVKIPRWDTHKMHNATRILGTEMKSVGEVMGIGRSFPEALQKAVGMLNIGATCLLDYPQKIDNLAKEIEFATDRRIFALYQWFESGYSLKEAQHLSQVSPWFLEQIEAIALFSKNFSSDADLNHANLLQAKKLGLSDLAIANIHSTSESFIRQLRHKYGILPYVKQIDTVAGEFQASSNYLYLTYYATTHDIQPSNEHICILGSGPYSIGSSVEFDWCTVNLARELRKLKQQVIIINSNPETVSTDYDESDRLYFEPLTFERVADILDFENVQGTVVSVGGQIANNLALKLANNNYPVLGTKPENIHRAEDRQLFSELLYSEGIDQPRFINAVNIEEINDFIAKVGFPVIIRPSYVLSGSAMKVVTDMDSLNTYLANAQNVSKHNSVVISEFIENAKEIDIDGIANNGEIVFSAIAEHLENAGVHSGDATLVYPAQSLSKSIQAKIKYISDIIVSKLLIHGPFNMQMILKDNTLKVIECNVRASRSFPFIAKVNNYNLMQAMALVFLNLPKQILSPPDILGRIGVKTPVFSYNRFKGSDPVPQVEMSSTGEVACISNNFDDSFYDSWQASGQMLKGNHILLTLPNKAVSEMIPIIRQLTKEDWKIYSYGSTLANLKLLIPGIIEDETPTLDLIANGQINLVINIPDNIYLAHLNQDEFNIRRQAIDYHIPLISNLQIAKTLFNCIIKKE